MYPITTSVSTGNLPPGLTLNAQTGALSGIPSKAGSYAFTLKSTDSFQPPQTATANESMVLAPPATLSVNPLFANPQANVPFALPITVTGGVPPYSYSISAGTLPAGLALDQSGSITGMAQVAGTSNFSITVTDSLSPGQSATAPGTIMVLPPPPESGTVTVTATSGQIVNTVTINVSVPAPASSSSILSTRR